jgi:PAS domain S-box-containing protein
MKESLRKSGIDVIGDVPWGTHFCQFYQTKEDLMDILVPYFKSGLENNELCVWVISQPLEVGEAKEALRRVVPDFDIYLEKGQIEIIPCTHENINEGVFGSENVIKGWVKKLDPVLAGGYEGLRTAGDISWSKKGELDDFVDYESEVDANSGKYQAISLFPYFLDMCSAADIIKIAFNHQFALIKKEGKWERIENIGRKYSPAQTKVGGTLFQNGQLISLKLENAFSPEKEKTSLDLADIIDVQAIQSLMDDFYEFAHITIAIVDLKGNVLVSIGWQDICTRFHRVHPEACKHCVESDTKLSAGVPPGEFKLYRCKNNMWDTATPIMVGDQHVGNIFSGQFFFEDEPLDYELFRSQARKYGFDEEEYIAALEKVPRLSSEVVATAMAFFAKLANMLSQLSYSNIKLARSLAERNTLVDALREGEEKYRNLMETANEGIWVLDAKARTTYVNEKMAEMLGCSREAIIGKSVRDFTDEEGKAIFEMNMNKRQQVISESHEFKLLCKDGLPLWALVNSKALFDKDGKFTGSISMLTDITERKRAEEALRFSNIYNRSLIEASLDPLVTIGRDGKITDVNSASEKITGYSRNELIGTDFSDYFTEPEKARAGYQQVFINGEVRDYLLEIRHRDGHITPVLYNASVYINEDGKVIGVFAAARDISELKKAEEKIEILANAVESSEDAIITKSLDGIITSWNKGAEKVHGYSAEEVLGKDVSILEPDNLKGEIKYFSEKIKQGEKIQHYETSRLKKDGTIISVSVTLSPVFDASRELVAISTIARDITERKKAEEALKRAHENLEEIVKVRTAELEKAYHSLKDSEKGLAEAQKMAHIGNWEWDIAADKAYWSEEMYRIFGRDLRKAAPSYNEYLNYIHPDYRDHYCDAIKKAVIGKPFGIDFRVVLDNGEERIVHLKSEFVMDNKNIPVRIKGIVQDITERKKSEEKIRIMANAVESSNDAIATESLEGIITSWNEGAEQIYGYSAEEILGKNASIVEPDNIKGEIKQLIEKIKQREQVQHYETFRLKKDGTIINVSVTMSPVFDATGELVAISAIARDITERKRVEEKLRESEEKYRNIVETANEGIFIIDAETTVTYANKKMTDMLGYTLEEVIGRAIWDFVGEEGKVIIKRNLEKRRQGINESYELKLICKGGSSLWVLINAKSLLDKDGRFMGVMSMLTDITERKEAEEALANIEIARKQEIHHRIKNNLQVISSLLDLQAEKFNNREDIKDSEVLEAFRESQDRVISMALIHEELYKGGAFDTLNFSSYIEELAENLFQTYSLGNADISLNMDLEENIFFDMDIAVPLGIIVNELVSNSIKHAFTGKEGEIRIQFCREEKDNEIDKSLFSLTISDNGKGIPENVELESVESLGLQLVNILVDQLDGKIELNRTHGTEFRITFKVAERS